MCNLSPLFHRHVFDLLQENQHDEFEELIEEMVIEQYELIIEQNKIDGTKMSSCLRVELSSC